MTTSLPVKKAVAFHWNGYSLSFDVAQELFSSHQIDRGSRMLLDSLIDQPFAPSGSAADFGCGYGVLGVAWQAAHPEWKVHYVDRDALAVAFTRHNVHKQRPELAARAVFNCDVTLPVEQPGYDVVLWNVPGKAGRQVIGGLLQSVLNGLRPGGVLAVVVVNPLADLFQVGPDRADVTVAYLERGKEHTIVHLRREDGPISMRDPFASGVFDREEATFEVGEFQWRLTPVVGLPEYDSLNHATELAIRAMIATRDDLEVNRWMIFDPGVGHLPVVAARVWPNAVGYVYGRDGLAIQAADRALQRAPTVDAAPVWGLQAAAVLEPVDALVIALPAQTQPDELGDLLGIVRPVLQIGGIGVFHGRSTEVARLERLMRKRPEWRPRKPAKLRGSAAVVASLSE